MTTLGQGGIKVTCYNNALSERQPYRYCPSSMLDISID